MEKVSAVVVANAKGGYDFITKTVNTKPFVIPTFEEDIPKTDNASKTDSIQKTNRTALPDYIYTKTEPKRSDEEILKDMEALAKEHARTGIHQHECKEYSKLMEEYISSVSPDRESIYNNATNEIYERLAFEMSGTPLEEAKEKNEELIEYFMKTLAGNSKNSNDIISSNIATRGNSIASSFSNNMGNVIATRSDGYYTQYDIDRGGGKVTSITFDSYGKQMPNIGLKGNTYDEVWFQNGIMKNAEYYDSNSEKILSNNGTIDRIDQLETKAERERYHKILGVYNASFDVAVGRHLGSEGSSKEYREAYDSTYERLMSETA